MVYKQTLSEELLLWYFLQYVCVCVGWLLGTKEKWIILKYFYFLHVFQAISEILFKIREQGASNPCLKVERRHQ